MVNGCILLLLLLYVYYLPRRVSTVEINNWFLFNNFILVKFKYLKKKNKIKLHLLSFIGGKDGRGLVIS